MITFLLLAAQVSGQSMSRATLLPGWQTADGTRMIGVRIDLAPGWKTYWRAPGGSGIPPDFDFSGSRNLAGAKVYWPRPGVYEVAGQRILGYSDHVVFPIELSPKGDAPIRVDLSLFYGVCETVCIPVEERLTLRIAPADTGGADAIRDALARLPRSGAEAGVTAVHCAITPRDDGYAVAAEVSFGHAPRIPQAVIFETGRDDLYFAPTDVRASGKILQVKGDMHFWGEGALALDRSALRLTLLDRDMAVDLQGCPAR